MTDKKKDNQEEFDDEDFDLEELEDDVSDEYTDEEEYDETLEDDSWDETAEAPAPQDKKAASPLKSMGEKKSLLSTNNIIIGGAVIVGGIIMISTISGQTTAQKATTANTFRSTMNISGVMDKTIYGDTQRKDPDETDAEKVDASANEGGFLNNPEQAVESAVSPRPAETADADNAIMLNNTPPRAPDDGAVPAIPGVNDNSGAAPEIAAPVPDIAQNHDAVQVEVPEDGEIDSTGSAEALLKQGLEERAAAPAVTTTPMAAAESAVDVDPEPAVPDIVAETPATQPIIPVVPAPSLAQADPKALARLEEKLDGILERLEKVETDLGNVDDGQKGEDYARLSQDVERLRTQVEAGVPARSSAPVNKPAVKAAVKKPVEKKVVAAVVAPAAVKPSGKWVLRAAQPGRAWVSRAGERDMQSIEVGQTLPGIGRINAITFDAGVWKITGTQGVIVQ